MVSRVHWLLHSLPIDFLRSYKVCYDYVKHNYFFYRSKGYKVKDCYTIVRTSNKCFRLTYFNSDNNKILYYHCRTAKRCAMFMYQLFIEYG